jgi:TolA-binding protein
LLLESASAALMRGDPVSAQSALQEHARRFPNGALAPEREVLRAQASRAAGKPQGAKPE